MLVLRSFVHSGGLIVLPPFPLLKHRPVRQRVFSHMLPNPGLPDQATGEWIQPAKMSLVLTPT